MRMSELINAHFYTYDLQSLIYNGDFSSPLVFQHVSTYTNATCFSLQD